MTRPLQPATTDPLAGELCRLVRADASLMHLLGCVAQLRLDAWCIAAGAVRNRVWDHLHGYTEPTPTGDIDVLFFDDRHSDARYERELEERLAAIDPRPRWEVVNQATVHRYTGDVQPYRSIDEAMSRWVDPMTAVGVSLAPDGSLQVVAPLGLRDLFDMVVQPHLVAPDAARIYRERVASKQWTVRWPRVTVVPLPP